MRNKEKIIKDLTALTATLSGVPAQNINGADRRREVVMARMALGNFLLNEIGLHYTELERLTPRDRCSYYYYEGKHNDSYKFDKDYKELYDALNMSYYGNRDNNISIEDIKSELLINNIGDNSYNSDFRILLTIGGLETKIFCKDLSDTIDKINNTFKDYDFAFKVSHVNSLRYE